MLFAIAGFGRLLKNGDGGDVFDGGWKQCWTFLSNKMEQRHRPGVGVRVMRTRSRRRRRTTGFRTARVGAHVDVGVGVGVGVGVNVSLAYRVGRRTRVGAAWAAFIALGRLPCHSRWECGGGDGLSGVRGMLRRGSAAVSHSLDRAEAGWKTVVLEQVVIGRRQCKYC